jgi:hypothetical protein
MKVIDKLVTEWAYRCKKGYPDMNNPDDLKILKEIYSEYGIVFEEEKPQEEVEYSADDLIKLLQDKKSELDSAFIQKMYHTVVAKGKKLGTQIMRILKSKELQSSANEIFSIINQYPGLEQELANFLQHPERQVTIAQLQTGTNLVDTIQKVTNLPKEFLSIMLKAGRASEGGKGVGEGEALLALTGKGGKKLKVGDVEIEGKELEVKAQGGRLIGRTESLTDLYNNLEQLGVSPRKLGKGVEALHTYIPNIITSDSTLENKVRDLVEKEFNTISGVDLTSPESIKTALLEWYVNYFLANEAKSADYIIVIMGGDYGIYTKQEFKEAILNRDLLVQNFTATNKSPQLSSFA